MSNTTSTEGAAPLVAIDCDVHPAVPLVSELTPHLEAHWVDHLSYRGVEDLALSFEMSRAPFFGRPDWRDANGKTAASVDELTRSVFGQLGSSMAILNPLWGAQLMFDGGMAAALCRALNDWIAREWLDKDDRLRASIIIPTEHPRFAAQEIERCAADKRFVQVLILAMNEAPIGREQYWPILEAAEAAGLPLGIHAGTSYRHAPTSIGWPSHHLEDFAAQSGAFQTQVASLLYENAFGRFPNLKTVLYESGVAWLSPFLWRQDKTWRGMRMEIPWIKEPPSDILKRHVRMTVTPFYGPKLEADVVDLLQQIDGDHMLLFASDFPRWHFEGNDPYPANLPASLRQKIMVDNPLETFSRLEVRAQ